MRYAGAIVWAIFGALFIIRAVPICLDISERRWERFAALTPLLNQLTKYAFVAALVISIPALAPILTLVESPSLVRGLLQHVRGK